MSINSSCFTTPFKGLSISFSKFNATGESFMDSTLITKFLLTKFWSEVELTLIKCVPIFCCEGDPSSTSALGYFDQ